MNISSFVSPSMSNPGEIGGAILLVFLGFGILTTIYSALYGGNVSGIVRLIGDLAAPIVLVAILVSIAVLMFNVISGT